MSATRPDESWRSYAGGCEPQLTEYRMIVEERQGKGRDRAKAFALSITHSSAYLGKVEPYCTVI